MFHILFPNAIWSSHQYFLPLLSVVCYRLQLAKSWMYLKNCLLFLCRWGLTSTALSSVVHLKWYVYYWFKKPDVWVIQAFKPSGTIRNTNFYVNLVLPPLVVGRKNVVVAGHVTTQNLDGEKNCWKGRAIGFLIVPVTIEYPPTWFWMDKFVTWPAATRVFFLRTKGGRGERPGERGCFYVI